MGGDRRCGDGRRPSREPGWRGATHSGGGYVEFFSLYSFESGADWAAQFDAGLTYAVSDDIQLDAGCNFGLTDAAPEIQPFVGVSIGF